MIHNGVEYTCICKPECDCCCKCHSTEEWAKCKCESLSFDEAARMRDLLAPVPSELDAWMAAQGWFVTVPFVQYERHTKACLEHR